MLRLRLVAVQFGPDKDDIKNRHTEEDADRFPKARIEISYSRWWDKGKEPAVEEVQLTAEDLVDLRHDLQRLSTILVSVGDGSHHECPHCTIEKVEKIGGTPQSPP